MLIVILILDQQWVPNHSDFPPISWPWYRAWPSPIMSAFHGAFATGVACQQGTLTLPDTWFCPPLWDLLVLQLLKPDSSNLPCLCSTFHLECPLVLSRFCLQRVWHASRERLPFRTPGSVPHCATCFCSNCETRFLELAMSLCHGCSYSNWPS